MKIVNIDASEKSCKQTTQILDFVLDVVGSLNNEMGHMYLHQIIMPYHGNSIPVLPLFPIRKFEEEGYGNIANLLHTIPIYLRKSRPVRYDESDIVDALGAYFQNRKNDDPYIEMYVDTIDDAVKGDSKHFKWLFTKVLIHELAHAALDIFNCESCHLTSEKVLYSTKFGKWREESMANAAALRVIKNFGDEDFYNYAKQFMLAQPAEYALGVLMEDFHYWDFRSVMDGKRNGVNPALQQAWLTYVQGKPVWPEIKKWNEVLSDPNIFIYNNKFYTDHQDLVLDILKDFIKQKGSISFQQLCAVFPNVKVQSKEAYRPWNDVKNDSQFYTESDDVLKLADGDYALYKYWYNSDLSDFLLLAQKNGFVVDTLVNY